MNRNEARTRVFVDEEPIDITPGTTSGDILRSRGYDTENRSLVQFPQSGKPRIMKSNEIMKPENGTRVESQINAVGG